MELALSLGNPTMSIVFGTAFQGSCLGDEYTKVSSTKSLNAERLEVNVPALPPPVKTWKEDKHLQRTCVLTIIYEYYT